MRADQANFIGESPINPALQTLWCAGERPPKLTARSPPPFLNRGRGKVRGATDSLLGNPRSRGHLDDTLQTPPGNRKMIRHKPQL